MIRVGSHRGRRLSAGESVTRSKVTKVITGLISKSLMLRDSACITL